ncbi:MAG TPA: response regulator [Kofleriaceae bacterium]|nr:response regulator [Kofleriaceae bacterium]
MNERVLVIDDSLTVRMDLAEALAAAGFAPCPCATLAEARRALADDPPAVVVLDVRLPDGDGIGFLRELRALPAHATTPVLLLSSEAEVKDRIRGLQTGADEYVGKPYDSGYVIGRARELLRERARERAEAATSILLIDDSLTFRARIGELLEAAGYQVLVAGTGEEGLRLAADRRPSAIIVDGHLPGIDGPTVIRRIRLDAALRGTPCLLLTGSDEHDAELRALDAGADAFLRKQADTDVVLARLAAALRGTRAASPAATASLAGPRRILVAGDPAGDPEVLADTLRAEGNEVIAARSGEEALELLAVQGVDCILLDDATGGLLGALETCRRIKAAPVVRDIPVIVLTAADRAPMLDALAAGADDAIARSGALEVLTARVRAQLRRKQLEDESRRARDQLLAREIAATEARAARELADTRAALVDELERKNAELEAFSYSVSHDLRAPLRAIDGFAYALAEDYGALLDADGQKFLRYVRDGVRRMNELIDDMLELSRIGRAELTRQRVDLSALAEAVVGDLRRAEPARAVEIVIAPGLHVSADRRMMQIVLENLLGNAWKFTGRTPHPRVEVGATGTGGARRYFVRDNGAGFDMQFAGKLFAPFQRLHGEAEFKGTGIGLATVRRVIERHGGRIGAEATVGQGATIWFTLP